MRLIDADAIQFENSEFDTYSDYSRAFDAIDYAPTIKTFTLADIEEQYRKGMEKGLEEAERPHGEWKYHKYDKDYECSICNTRYDAFDLPVKTWDYCPNCGARMTGEGESE